MNNVILSYDSSDESYLIVHVCSALVFVCHSVEAGQNDLQNTFRGFLVQDDRE